MMIFIGNLPERLTSEQLACALKLPADTARRLRLVSRPTTDGRRLRYALVHMRSEREARRLLDPRGQFLVNGQTLQLREFVKRVAGNERRSLDWRSRPWPYAERRQRDRRGAASQRSRAA